MNMFVYFFFLVKMCKSLPRSKSWWFIKREGGVRDQTKGLLYACR